jgi:uncharacterized protein YdhG (YjbR/CyaY superfamily)
MQSQASTVDLYLMEVPADRLEALTKLRQIFLSELKGYDETMRYGMPSYERNNITEAGFASQKNSINIYILKTDVMNEYKHLLKGVSIGKGCLRFSRLEKIDFDVIQKMLTATYQSINSICG